MTATPHTQPQPSPRAGFALLALAAFLAASVAATVLALPAGAQGGFPPPQFWDRCDSSAPAGERCDLPRGVAANPDNGRVYVADQEGLRIVEYSAWGELVRMRGWDVVASGDGDTAEDEFEVCVPADGDVCKGGTRGAGPGQFDGIHGVAVDSAGDVYANDRNNRRVQKFSPDGDFLLMFGGGVNQGGGTPSNPGDVCTAEHVANGDACGAGSQGSDPGEFGNWAVGDFVDVGPNDEIYVGDVGRIQRFNTSGIYQDELTVSGTVQSLATDPDGNLYYRTTGANVHKLSPAGAELNTIPADAPIALATDPDGNLYVSVDRIPAGPSGVFHPPEIRKYSPSGALLATHAAAEGTITSGQGEFQRSFGIAVSPVTADGDLALYLTSTVSAPNAFVRAYSPLPDPDIVGPPPPAAPTVSEFADAVGVSDARIAADINPRFWDDATYYAEYGSDGPCESNPCDQVGFPGIALDSGVTDSPKQVKVTLTGLEPKTTYHFRFVAESGGGGPTIGAGATFDTYAPTPAPRTDCPNQQFRTGPSARLPDCRAYEMVSPVDKAGGDAVGPGGANGGGDATPGSVEASHFQATAGGGAVTYNSARPFGEVASAPLSTQYIARRDPEAGWSSTALNPAQERNIPGDFLFRQHNYFDHFSDDLSTAWFNHFSEPQPDPGAVPGYKNLYRRATDAEQFTALTTVTPPAAPGGTGDGSYDSRLGGYSKDGSVAVFSANDRLVAGASNATTGTGSNLPINQTYEHRDGEPLRLVSVLPGGAASDQNSVFGGGRPYRMGAVSEDGSRIYWTTGGSPGDRVGSRIAGRIFVRVDGQTTIPVSETVSSAPASFLVGARDGSAALFTIGSSLYRFDLESESSTLVATGLNAAQGVGVGGGSLDLDRAYFLSRDILDPEPNSHGDVAIAAQENLYLYAEGEGIRFIARPGAGFTADPTADASISAVDLPRRLSHTTPDGGHLLFAARNPLTGYDSTDALSGERNLQVFRYAAETDELHCISCNPSGARSRGRPGLLFPLGHEDVSGLIPGWRQGSLYQQRALSDDGQRVYFDSYDDLLPADTNGKADVYQWQAPGSGECTTDHPQYFERNGGCLSLISTGRGDGDSTFIEATPTGSTAFIRTPQSLVPQDSGAFDIYAARTGGGIPFASPPPPCEGDACQPPAEVPEDQTPASADFEGQGNQRPASDCAVLQRQARRAAQRSRSQRQRAKRLRQRAKRQARRGNARKAKRARQRAGRVGRRARSSRQQARRIRGEARACREEQGDERSRR